MPTLFQSTLQPASFAGVPFYVLDSNVKDGQRAQVHQYPFRSTPYTEELGRQATQYQITGYLVGDQVVFLYQQMLAVIRAPGAATLVHPSLGAQQVICLNCDSIQNIAGRYVELRFTFVEAGQVLYPSTGSDTAAASATTSQAGQTQQASDTSDTDVAATATPDSVAASASPTTLSAQNDAVLNNTASPDTSLATNPDAALNDQAAPATAIPSGAAASVQSSAETSALGAGATDAITFASPI